MQLKHQGIIIAGVALLSACGGSTTSADGPQGTSTPAGEVAATPSIAFTPNTLTVVRGATVTFDFGSVPHNVYFDTNQAGAPANIAGENVNVRKSLTFNTAGTFGYECHIHPGMRGTVVVVESATSSSGPDYLVRSGQRNPLL